MTVSSNKVSKIIILLLCPLAGIFVISQVLTIGWNVVTQTVKYLGGGCLVVGFFKPRLGFWVLIGTFACMDLIKRLIVLGETATFFDLTLILAFPPIMAVVIFVSLFARDLLMQNIDRRRKVILLLMLPISLLMLGVVFGGESEGSTLGVLKQGANYIAFTTLIYTVPALFPDIPSLRRMVGKLVWIMFPVGIYGVWQYFFGLADFEIKYLMTGFSMEQRILFGQDFRVFSTLNSSQNLSKIMGMMGAVSVMAPLRKRNSVQIGALNILMCAFFFFVAYASGSRTGFVMGLMAIGMYYGFQSRAITAAIYGCLCLVVSLVVVFSDKLVDEK